jgi:AcrR family transcriptional regulator
MHQNGTNPSELLVETALALMASRSGGPGLRDIAAAAGVSPSLINYRFGSVVALKEAALVASLEQDARRWATRQRDLLSAPVSRSDLAGLLNELLITDTRPDDRLAALRWLRILKVVRGGVGEPGPFSSAEQDFWALLALKLDLSCGEEHTLKAFFHGLAFGHLIGAASPGFHAWSSSLVDRFAQRLFGRPVSWLCADSAWRSVTAEVREPAGGSGSAHPTRQAILEAAMRIMIEEGVNSLTHRRLAIDSSASVSSVIHFFNGRRAILKEAYGLLYQRLCERALNGLEFKDEVGSLSPRALAERLAARDPQGEQGNRDELAGLLNAMFEASRDSETAQLALSLFARSGETSRNLLRYLPGFEEGAGWLDAQIFRFVSNGLMFLSLGSLPGAGTSPGSAMIDGLGDALTVLFGER